MTKILNHWYRKYFSDPQAVVLAFLLITGSAIVLFFGGMLAPVFASAVIAYVLEGLVSTMERWRIPRFLAVSLVLVVFLAFLLFLLFGLVPLLSAQLTQLVQELPNMIQRGQKVLLLLPERYPNFITEEQVRELFAAMRAGVTHLGQNLVSLSLASISQLFSLVLYLVLLPVLVFFFLRDKKKIMNWFRGYLPNNRRVANQVGQEMDQQLGNYIRGKFTEILIVGAVSFLAFRVLGLHYAMLLGALVGLSVVVPYVGAVAVTVPVVLIAYFQFGGTQQFLYVLVTYTVIQVLDGNLLVPWLFSEAVNLHPIAIVSAVLLFGGLWGFWGVFFAIPLATLVKAVMTAWPRTAVDDPQDTAPSDPDQAPA